MEIQLESGKLLDMETEILYSSREVFEKNIDKQRNKVRVAKKSNYILTILPTENCNFKCIYCYEKLCGPKWNSDNEKKIYQFVDKVLETYDGITLSWFGGEPLLEYDVVRRISSTIMRKCIKLKKIFDSNITTNASLLTIEKMKGLLKLGVTSFQITLDGVQEKHDSKRVTKGGGASYSTIMNNLEQIAKLNFEFFDILIRLNITRNDVNDLKEHSNLLTSKFGSDKRFSFFIRPVGDWGGDSVKCLNNDLIEPKELFSIISEQKINLNFINHFRSIFRFLCYAAESGSVVLGPDLRMMKCTVLLDDYSNYIGSLVDYKLETIEFPLYSLGMLHNSECLNCMFDNRCKGYSCPVAKINKPNNSQCGYEQENFDSILKMIDNEKTLAVMKASGVYIEE